MLKIIKMQEIYLITRFSKLLKILTINGKGFGKIQRRYYYESLVPINYKYKNLS